MTKDQVFLLISSKIDEQEKLMLECYELAYNAGFNEAIEAAAKLAETSKGYPTTVSQKIAGLMK